MAKREHITKHRQEVDAAKERIALFKAAWTPSQKSDKDQQRRNISEHFSCSGKHVLCKPIEPVMCTCDRRPVVEPEAVDLYSYGQVPLVVHPSLDSNEPYLNLLHHSPFHHTPTSISEPLTVTFADVAAAAGNVDLLRHLFTSPDLCVRSFYAEHYSYQDPVTLLTLFVHALNGGCHDVVMFLVEKFFEELTAQLKVAILEACLWLATTEKSIEVCFQQLALKFGVNIMNDDDTYCPLHLTCMYDNGDAAAFLIDHGADMYVENTQHCTVAYCAYKYGTFTFGLHRVLKTMLDKGLRVDAVMVKGSHFQYPLMYTMINHSQLGLVQYLVQCGHDVNLPIRYQAADQDRSISPLMHALVCRSVSCAAWLIKQGADVNSGFCTSLHLEDDSWTPLHMAALLGNLSIIRSLVQRGALVDAVTATGETVMSVAFERLIRRQPSYDLISYLIQINAPVQSIPNESYIMKKLLQRCAYETVSGSFSMLDIAVLIEEKDIIDVLLKGGHHPRVSGFTQGQYSLCQKWAVKKVEELAALKKVPLLQELCRCTLRNACGLRLLQYVDTTAMPSRLRSYLLMEDLFGPLDRRTDDEDGDVSDE